MKKNYDKEYEQSPDATFFDLVKTLQLQNSDATIILVENKAGFDLLVPTHKTNQYLLQRVDDYYVLYATPLNERTMIYLFSKEIGYLAREHIKSWTCCKKISKTGRQ